MTETTAQKGHPKGLWVLFGTEMWERFNYYGMRAVLVLFMTKALLFDKVFASNLYGSYTSLVYLTPLIGGYIADRYWGNQRSIIAGGIVMALGEFLLFFCGSTYQSSPDLSSLLFFSGLGLMIAGNGFFKPNISSLVGQLYPKNDKRIDPAYTIFYMGINVGGALGPFICGLVGDTGDPIDFKWAFLAGGIAMLLSVVVQLMFHKKYVLGPDNKVLGLTPAGSPAIWVKPIAIILGLAAFSSFAIGLLYIDAKVVSYLTYLLAAGAVLIFVMVMIDKTLSRFEKERVMVLFAVVFFVIFFWSAFEQAGASLTFFAEEQTQRDLGFFTVPSSWFQSLNSVFVVAFAPVFAWLWVKLGKKEPSAPTKMAWGLFLLSIGYIWIAYGVKGVQPGIKISMIFLIGMYVLHTWGELCLSPIGLSLANKLAPFKYASLLMGVWFLGNAFANKLAGTLSALYPEDQKKEASYSVNIADIKLDSTTFVWSSLGTQRTLPNQNQQLKIEFIKKSEKSDKPDSIKTLEVVSNTSFKDWNDTFKINRLIPSKLREKELKLLAKQGKQEAQFKGFLLDNGTKYAILKENEKNASVGELEVYNLYPEKPTLLGRKINSLYDFFILFVVMAGVASLILFLLTKKLQKMMHTTEE